MDTWKYEPAKDLGLTEAQRLRSVRRETGLIAAVSRHCWWTAVRSYFHFCQHVTVEGREHLPTQVPFLLVSNHCSHLDAMILACQLPPRLRHRVFPIAAGDTFFETRLASAFAAGMMNALPMWRKNAGRHAMQELRDRLLHEPAPHAAPPGCGYILFPEGTRSRTGTMAPFRAGVGMVVANTPVPVIPCHLDGTFHALPPDHRFPRRTHIRLRVAPPLCFPDTPNTREGWNAIAATLESAIRTLATSPVAATS
jgi:1-acyl-sn-glycerol-3-phosphate acyltransferase